MKKYILFFTLLIIVLKILGQKKIFKSKISNEINFNSFKHLFILSGQSNMVGLDPDESFIPILEKKFGKEKIIIIKDATSGQPIRRWNKNWKGKNFEIKDSIGNLYNSLINKVRKVVINKKINTVTFIWMQGERMLVRN